MVEIAFVCMRVVFTFYLQHPWQATGGTNEVSFRGLLNGRKAGCTGGRITMSWIHRFKDQILEIRKAP